MKVINLIFIMLFAISSAQELKFPKLISETDTLSINQNKVTQKSLWVQSVDSEIKQRHTIADLESRLQMLSDISDQIDQDTYSVISTKDLIIQEKNLRIEQAENSLTNISNIVQSQNDKLEEYSKKSLKFKAQKNFWRSTTIGVGIVTVTAIVVKAIL